jgi:hypothetical protein
MKWVIDGDTIWLVIEKAGAAREVKKTVGKGGGDRNGACRWLAGLCRTSPPSGLISMAPKRVKE